MTLLPFEDLPADGEPIDPNRARERAFEQFWEKYPRKVGKRRARPAFNKAWGRARWFDIMAGLDRYKRHKPDYCDWMHPATFLNGRRWEDEYDTAPPKPDDDAVWRDKAARMIKFPEYKQPRQDVEEAFRRGLVTAEQREAAL